MCSNVFQMRWLLEKGAFSVSVIRQTRDVRFVATEISIAPLKMPPRSEEGRAPGREKPTILRQVRVTATINSQMDGTTIFYNRTCLYADSRGDHDPNLLRHLDYDDLGRFGDDLWTVWRASNPATELSYLAMFMSNFPYDRYDKNMKELCKH
jgi:hypothetical protein